MDYNTNIHHRKSIRLKGYDYSQAGAYFITICCRERKCFFGNIENHKIILNEFGNVAYNEWNKLPERFKNVELDVFQIMPNHMHAILVLVVGATLAVAHDNNNAVDDITNINTGAINRARVNRAPTTTTTITVGGIIGAYKSLVANKCLEIYKQQWTEVNGAPTMGKLWQRNYYEHIIRNEQSYQTISNYIINNPAKWNDDKFFI